VAKGEAAVQLSDAETGLLEDCYEDWRGLWEVVWDTPNRSVQEAISFLTPLVERGYLTTLKVNAWDQARAATPMALQEALAIVSDEASYAEPEAGGSAFYLLAITKDGEAAIPWFTGSNGS
jgi:hypothetical protein